MKEWIDAINQPLFDVDKEFEVGRRRGAAAVPCELAVLLTQFVGATGCRGRRRSQCCSWRCRRGRQLSSFGRESCGAYDNCPEVGGRGLGVAPV